MVTELSWDFFRVRGKIDRDGCGYRIIPKPINQGEAFLLGVLQQNVGLFMKSKFSSLLLSTVISTILFYLLMKFPSGTDIGIIGAAGFAVIYFAGTMLISRFWPHTKNSD